MRGNTATVYRHTPSLIPVRPDTFYGSVSVGGNTYVSGAGCIQLRMFDVALERM